MKTADQILALLSETDCTAGALAERLHQPCKVLEAFLQDLELTGQITSQPIAGDLLSWKLTKPTPTTEN
jgi:hypothetical protein